jgi:RNA polymerase sigma factor (sigma-70 family)
VIKQSDETIAIEALSKRFRRPLQRFFEKRVRQPDEIEDLVQEVFVRLAAGGTLDLQSSQAYLFQIATNLLYDRHRRRVAHATDAHVSYDEILHGGAAGTFSAEREALGQEAIACLVAALYELPERTRDVFALHHFEDLPHEQIARRLGIAKSTVEKHMSRAGAHLLKRLDRKT